MKAITPQQARQKIERYCAYQERSHQEVRNKLYGYGLFRGDVDEILTHLITDGFLNEERFARAYAGGKFRMKQWGKIKITNALEAKGVSANCIRLGLKEIDEEEYLTSLREIVRQKISLLNEKNEFVLRDKIARYLLQKGYEPELVWGQIFEVLPKK